MPARKTTSAVETPREAGGAAKRPLEAKPRTPPPDVAALRERVHERFARTMARLAD